MLHVSPQGGQARRTSRWAGWIASSMILCACAAPLAHAQQTAPTLAQAEALARDGQHLEAASRYERLARRGFMNWDAATALLAAREYVVGGAVKDAQRLVARVRSRVRSDDERALLAEVEARVALAGGDAARALSILRTLAQPWPAESAPELLALRGQAEIATGDALGGVRTFEERAALLASPAARAENDRLLYDCLRQRPPGAVTAAGVSERERGWLELPAVVTAGSDDAADPATVAAWMGRHPGHPGAAFLPAAGQAQPGFATIGGGRSTSIALLLPLSGKQQSAGGAVRDGFAAAWFASSPADMRPRIEIYDTATPDAAAAYQRAIADGARMVVGPLTKEEIAAVVASQPTGLPVPTLALNYATVTPGVATPAFLYQFALDPEQEARAVARRIADDGWVRGVALFPDNTWGQRVHDAFVEELQAAGSVALMSSQYYAADARDFSGPLRAVLGRYGGAGDRSSSPSQSLPPRNAVSEQASGPQFAFVAATPQAARAIRPQLRFQMTYDLPLYATSDAWDPSVRAAADMDGMVFPEMPWLLYGGQGAPELWDALQEDWSARSRGRLRLFAFGYDAFRLAQQLASSGGIAAGVDGLTGVLELDRADGRVQRSLQFARVESGKPQVAGSTATVFRETLPANSTGDPPPR
ncbi:MAG: penicillin-binding protein activator [Gammaproteobacteria bacterium]|nr:penicillin-binding protein activator [Gammaproteobacteria bacterium]